MKKLLALSLIGSSLIIGSNPAKADWDYWAIKENQNSLTGIQLYKVDSSEGTSTLVTSFCEVSESHGCEGTIGEGSFIEHASGKIFVKKNGIGFQSYDPSTNQWASENNWKANYPNKGVIKRPSTRVDTNGNKILEVTGSKLIEKKSNGELHIGENSWITKEENGRQKVYAKDAAGNPIPIDYTNGTKLLINGRDVEQSINNVGALSAALTGLPTVPTDTTLACGLGTGTHGGDFAFSGGCASKINETLSVNYAASMTMPGQDYAGDFEDTFSARAGFVWKLGKSVKPNLVSMKENQKLTNEITDLKSENKKLNKKITKFETEKLELLARLERLEKIALSESKSQDLATIKLP